MNLWLVFAFSRQYLSTFGTGLTESPEPRIMHMGKSWARPSICPLLELALQRAPSPGGMHMGKSAVQMGEYKVGVRRCTALPIHVEFSEDFKIHDHWLQIKCSIIHQFCIAFPIWVGSQHMNDQYDISPHVMYNFTQKSGLNCSPKVRLPF